MRGTRHPLLPSCFSLLQWDCLPYGCSSVVFWKHVAVWLHRFTAGEAFCLRMSHTSKCHPYISDFSDMQMRLWTLCFSRRWNKLRLLGLLGWSECFLHAKSYIWGIGVKCFGLNVCVQNSLVEALIPSVAIFEDGPPGSN